MCSNYVIDACLTHKNILYMLNFKFMFISPFCKTSWRRASLIVHVYLFLNGICYYNCGQKSMLIKICKKKGKQNLLLKFNIDWCYLTCYGAKSSVGKNHSSTSSCRPRNRGLCPINDPNLNRLTKNACARNDCTYTLHQILSSTSSAVIPYTFSSCCKQITWWKLRCIIPITRSSCNFTIQNLKISKTRKERGI